ncbi:MAG: type II secretion system protein GspH, partial [Betaproteobacteria bacterium]|nr:type II secretion system protein GspH [Betaproteobacteria bacterium]
MLEIIVVVAIIGIVSAMTFPNIQEWLAKRR